MKRVVMVIVAMVLAAFGTLPLWGATCETVVLAPGAAGLAQSTPDAAGNFSLSFDHGPKELYLAQGERCWNVVVPASPGEVCEVRTFVGWDRGAIGEATLEINMMGQRLAERSEHKEQAGNYDAWRAAPARRRVSAGETFHMYASATQIAPNSFDAGLSTRVHFAFRVRMRAPGFGGCE